MLALASSLFAKINRMRLVSVVGEPGSGKDLVVHEIAEKMYLRAGYGFYSNQFSIWNDPLWIDLSKDRPDELRLRRGRVEKIEWENEQAYVVRTYGDGRVGRAPIKNNLFPDIYGRVVNLSEAGRYLRQYAYFEDLLEFTRKIKSFFFFPSVRPSHEDLMKLVISPRIPFKEIFGIDGGFWSWRLTDGFGTSEGGIFLHIPASRIIGVYDTDDFTETPNAILDCTKAWTEIDQICRGRAGIQTLGGLAIGVDADYQSALQRRFEQSIASVSRKKGQRRH